MLTFDLDIEGRNSSLSADLSSHSLLTLVSTTKSNSSRNSEQDRPTLPVINTALWIFVPVGLSSSGAYELDLTLVDDFEKTWREMHVKTDVFCSASIILPDIAGRQLNVGGWSLESTRGIRLYTPDGSPGVNGSNDWEEDVSILALQKNRWYPSECIAGRESTAK